MSLCMNGACHLMREHTSEECLRHDVLYGAHTAPASCVVVMGRTFTRPGTPRLAGTVATGPEAERFIERLLAIGFTEVTK